MQSTELTEFYRACERELLEGNMGDLNPVYGLCKNIYNFLRSRPLGHNKIAVEMTNQFIAAGLDEAFPFNAGADDYCRERAAGRLYINPARIAWIREHAK